jgi:pantoate kinase
MVIAWEPRGGGPIPCVAVHHHVTAFFIPHTESGDPLTKGSVGAGLLIDPLTRVCVGRGSIPSEGPLARVLRIMGYEAPLVVHEPLPARRGYATSAAVTLGAALGVAALRGSSLLTAARAAHVAEVEEGTGLGDVVAIYGGGPGVAVRLQAGGPGVGLVDYIPAPPGVMTVSVSRGEEHTSSLLARYTSSQREAAERALRILVDSMTFDGFLEALDHYVRLTRPLERLGVPPRPADGVIAAYAKKRVAVFLVEADRASDVAAALQRAGLRPFLHRPWRGGAPRVEWINPEHAPPWR